MATMIVQCVKCRDILGINEKKRRKLKNLSCPECGEESYENRLIVGDSKKPAPHNIDKLLKKQKEDAE